MDHGHLPAAQRLIVLHERRTLTSQSMLFALTISLNGCLQSNHLGKWEWGLNQTSREKLVAAPSLYAQMPYDSSAVLVETVCGQPSSVNLYVVS